MTTLDTNALTGCLVHRLPQNPIIAPDMLPGSDGCNINGPSLVTVPSWLPNPLGRFYLYFAHHKGRYIRLAFADQIEGPWKIYSPGTLQLEDTEACRDHIASPDVHVDHSSQEVRMYFHGVSKYGRDQLSFLALSHDGLNFRARNTPLANFYLRMTPWRDQWIGMAKGGLLYLSNSGKNNFEKLSTAFPMSSRNANGKGDVRHVALNCSRDELEVFFTRIGDEPEHIRRATIDLSQPIEEWKASPSKPVLVPETSWEGADLPLKRSRAGQSRTRENAVRDPAIFLHMGQIFLLYSVAGESGIGIAELTK